MQTSTANLFYSDTSLLESRPLYCNWLEIFQNGLQNAWSILNNRQHQSILFFVFQREYIISLSSTHKYISLIVSIFPYRLYRKHPFSFCRETDRKTNYFLYAFASVWQAAIDFVDKLQAFNQSNMQPARDTYHAVNSPIRLTFGREIDPQTIFHRHDISALRIFYWYFHLNVSELFFQAKYKRYRE